MKARSVILAAGVLILAASTAGAVSDGNYTPEEMGCSKSGNAYGPDSAEHGQDAGDDKCQAARLSVGTDNNEKLIRAGLDHEEPNENGFSGGHNPHHGTAWVGSPGSEAAEVHYGTGTPNALPVGIPFFSAGGSGPYSDDHDEPELEPTTNPDNAEAIDDGAPSELHVYFGADDNLESGEHDGVPETGCRSGNCEQTDNSELGNGPSDGGAIRVDVTPNTEDPSANADPTNKNSPTSAAYAGTGAGVDGIAFTAGTDERRIYDGGRDSDNDGTDDKVYMEDAGEDDITDDDDYCTYSNEENCVNKIHEEQPDIYARPGVTIYDDPDPQDSAIGFPGEGGTTHVGSGGVIIMGQTVVDTDDDIPASAEAAAEGASPCCAAATSGPNQGKACISDPAVNAAASADRQAVAGCAEVDADNCIGGAIILGAPAGCVVVGGEIVSGGATPEECTNAAVAACCANDACE